MSKRNLVENVGCINEEFIEEFVNVPSGLPVLLLNILDEIDEDVEIRRFRTYEAHPEFERLDEQEMETVSQLLKEGKSDEAQEFQIQYALDFLEDYPQFKCMVNGVESNINNDFRIMVNSIKEAFFGELDYF